MDRYIHTYIETPKYSKIYPFQRYHPKSSSSSSCRAGSTDIPDPLSPLFPIVHRLRQVFWTTSRILT